MSHTCPNCGSVIECKPKKRDTRLEQDLKRCRDAMEVIFRFLARDCDYEYWSNRTCIAGAILAPLNLTEKACMEELTRLDRALTDHTLLYHIYRRNDKAGAYA